MRNYTVTVNGKRLEAKLLSRENSRVVFDVGGKTYEVDVEANINRASAAPTPIPSTHTKPQATKAAAPGSIVAPMPGIIVQIQVKVGDSVKAGQTLLTMEAMKMENNVTSSSTGIVKQLHVKPGDEVMNGQVLISLQ